MIDINLPFSVNCFLHIFLYTSMKSFIIYLILIYNYYKKYTVKYIVIKKINSIKVINLLKSINICHFFRYNFFASTYLYIFLFCNKFSYIRQIIKR